MGAQQKTVGGGNATPVANSFNDFLMQQLNGGGGQQATNGNMIQQLQGVMNLPGANKGNIQNEINRLQSNQQQPQQQGNSAFQNIFNQFAGGQVNDQSGAGGMLKNFFGQYGGGQQQGQGNGYSGLQNNSTFMQNVDPNDPRINSPEFQQYMAQRGQIVNGQGSPQQNQGMGNGGLPTFQNPYQNQTFQGFNPSQLATNYGQGQTGMIDLSQFGGAGAPTNVDVMQGFGTQGGQSQFTNQIQQALGQLQNGGMQAGVQQVALDPAKQIDLNSPLIQAQQQIADRQRMMSVADQRARFGADGSGSLGTGAQVAEGNLNATFGPQMAALLQQNIMQQQGQDLAERQAKAGVGLQSAGQQLQASMANAGNSLQSGLGGLNAMLSGRGQDFNNQTANRGMDINQLGLGLNQAQGNQGAALTNQGQMLNGLLQNQGMGNSFGLNAFNANSANQQQNNANGMNMAGMQNNFNLANAGNMAQYGNSTNGLNLQSAMGGQGNLLQAIQMGLGMNQLGNSNQQNILSQLFGGFGQANGLGTPQAQSVMQPSGWGQAAQAGLGLAGSIFGGPAGGAAGSWLSGLFGGGTPQMAPVAGPSTPFNWQGQIGNSTWGGGMPVSRAR